MSYNIFSILWIIGSIPFILFSICCILKEASAARVAEYHSGEYFRNLSHSESFKLLYLSGLLAIVPLFIGGSVAEIVGVFLWVIIYIVLFMDRKNAIGRNSIAFSSETTLLYSIVLFIYFLIAFAFLFLFVANVDGSGWSRGITLGIISLLPFALPGFVVLAAWLIKPFSGKKDVESCEDAQSFLDSCPDLIRIAISGSYGKTSIKHILGIMTDEKYYTLVSSGSCNTPLSVSQLVRDQLKPVHQVLIAELGAKRPGDIREMADILVPNFVILTSLGNVATRTFDSMDAVIESHLELIDSLGEEDVAVMNFEDEIIRSHADRMKGTVISYGLNQPGLDFWASDISYHRTGMSFILHGCGEEIEIRTNLLGNNNILHIVGAAAMARQLGISFKQIKRAIPLLPQEKHCMELKDVNGIRILDDTVGTDLCGALAAVDVAKNLEAGTKYLITPGIFGAEENREKENREFAIGAAEVFDVIIPVGIGNKDYFKQGLDEAGFDESKIIFAASTLEANDLVKTKIKQGDLILCENMLSEKGRKMGGK